MSTLKDILADAIQCEMGALKNEELIEVKGAKGTKLTVQKGRQKFQSEATTKENKILVDSISMLKSNDDLLETNGVQKIANISTITRDLVPCLEDIQPVVP
ncbi:hypothetical protein ACOME3_007955 [Neoechinorhynchus agilis]